MYMVGHCFQTAIFTPKNIPSFLDNICNHLLRRWDHILKLQGQAEIEYLVMIVVNFVHKWAKQIFLGHHKIIPIWFIISKYFSEWWLLISLWSCSFTIFQSRIPKVLLSNSKVLNTCEDKKRRQILPVFK